MKHSQGFLKLAEEARSRIKEIGCQNVNARLQQGEKLHFFDVREDHEWQSGHAFGAKHLGKGIIERDIENIIPDKNEEIILYCGGGFRSALAADNLQKMGYTNVFSMAGGMREWIALKLPTGHDESKE